MAPIINDDYPQQQAVVAIVSTNGDGGDTSDSDTTSGSIHNNSIQLSTTTASGSYNDEPPKPLRQHDVDANGSVQEKIGRSSIGGGGARRIQERTVVFGGQHPSRLASNRGATSTMANIAVLSYDDAFPALSPSNTMLQSSVIENSAEKQPTATPSPTPLVNGGTDQRDARNNSSSRQHRRREQRHRLGRQSSSSSLSISFNNIVSPPSSSQQRYNSTNNAAADYYCTTTTSSVDVDGGAWPTQCQRGQRKLGPNPFIATRPPHGSELFLRHSPHDCYETEIMAFVANNLNNMRPVAEAVYEIRIMLDYVRRGTSRGFAFVLMASPELAQDAIVALNGKAIRPGFTVEVQESVDNCKLFVGSLPKTRTRDEIHREVSRLTDGVVDVTVYPSALDKSKTRGFAFVHYESHQAASHARTRLQRNNALLWECVEAQVDWAEPEKDCADEIMSRVKVLFVRNLMFSTTEDTLLKTFAPYGRIEKVKKLKDFAFIHYTERGDALKARNMLNDTMLDNAQIEVHLAKPPPPKSATQQQQHHYAMHSSSYPPRYHTREFRHPNAASNDGSLKLMTAKRHVKNRSAHDYVGLMPPHYNHLAVASSTTSSVQQPLSAVPILAPQQWQQQQHAVAYPVPPYANYYYPPIPIPANMSLSPSAVPLTSVPTSTAAAAAGWQHQVLLQPATAVDAMNLHHPQSTTHSTTANIHASYWMAPSSPQQTVLTTMMPFNNTLYQRHQAAVAGHLQQQQQLAQYYAALHSAAAIHAAMAAASATSGRTAENFSNNRGQAGGLHASVQKAYGHLLMGKANTKYSVFSNSNAAAAAATTGIVRRNATGQPVVTAYYSSSSKPATASRGFAASGGHVLQPPPRHRQVATYHLHTGNSPVAPNNNNNNTEQLEVQLKALLSTSGFTSQPTIRVEKVLTHEHDSAPTVIMYRCEILLSSNNNNNTTTPSGGGDTMEEAAKSGSSAPVLHCKPQQLLPSADEAKVYALKFVIDNLEQVLAKSRTQAVVVSKKSVAGSDVLAVTAENEDDHRRHSHDISPPIG